MKNQLRGIALIVFAVLIVVIGIAMTPDFSATFANITAIIGGFVGFFGVALVAGDHVTSALINGDYNISAGTFIAVISFVVRTIHIGAAVACGILAVAAWKCSKQKAPSALQAKGE